MKEQFIEKKFRPDALARLAEADAIINEYQAQGFTLTLRQLYYQFVARGLIPNTERSYKNLGSLINDGRLAGYLDWESIEDRTRNLQKRLHLRGPKHAVEVVAAQYGIDMWSNQPNRVEVWVEKEALAGVVAGICYRYDAPYFACRGYVSQSEQWRAYRRYRSHVVAGQHIVQLHLGDHDPSGIDMTRDNRDRLELFLGGGFDLTVERLALNMDQIEQYNPPPNPAKVTDSRFDGYQQIHGDESWELDALEPRVINDLIEAAILNYRDEDAWHERAVELHDQEETLNNIMKGLPDDE